jgi:hypothetical protein
MYQGYVLPEKTKADDYENVCQDYEHMLVAVMRALADRFDTDYPFVNTKLSLLTGKDFDANDQIRGRNAVYGWIQGRGLEALAGPCAWLKEKGLDDGLVLHLSDMIRLVLDRVCHMWRQNGERLWFFMLPDGRPFVLGDGGKPVPFVLTSEMPYGFSDLFASKGMYAAACYLEDEDAKEDALRYIEAVDDAIWAGRFENDQVTLDPQNPVTPLPGRIMHGPFMIQIGTAAMLVLQGEARGVAMGLRLIRHELDHYVNLDGRVSHLGDGDMWEAIGEDGLPYLETNGAILSDPGHALEFVGLALKFLEAAKALGLLNEKQHEGLAYFEVVMPGILKRNFENGFLGKGINKAFDLVSRKPMNTDLPWWNLPETMRAAVFCKKIATEERDLLVCDDVFRKCHNAFVQNFVRPDLMAYQTITEFGDPVDVIPATADADPGYHTGLSMIDVLDTLDSLYFNP